MYRNYKKITKKFLLSVFNHIQRKIKRRVLLKQADKLVRPFASKMGYRIYFFKTRKFVSVLLTQYMIFIAVCEDFLLFVKRSLFSRISANSLFQELLLRRWIFISEEWSRHSTAFLQESDFVMVIFERIYRDSVKTALRFYEKIGLAYNDMNYGIPLTSVSDQLSSIIDSFVRLMMPVIKSSYSMSHCFPSVFRLPSISLFPAVAPLVLLLYT